MEHDVVTCNVRLLLSRESHTVLRQDTIKYVLCVYWQHNTRVWMPLVHCIPILAQLLTLPNCSRCPQLLILPSC